ncbi:transport permease protein [Terasakiella brassicae]|uniref:Transport permease protein n=2 Tax=Terasakiella brassicae TaxID=1634917 RepID=A0A917C8P5_9PROT|nr:transport permease protein [Terasakiella brassicae]
MVLNPLAQVAIYALILSNVLSAKLPGIESQYAYAIYLMAGLLAWNLFSEIVSRCLTLFISQGALMKKISFPRITMPTIVVGSCLINNLLLFLSMLGVFTLLGHSLSFTLLWLFPLTLNVVMLAVGVGLILGVLNVFIRDIGQVVPIILQMGFWFTPVVYPINIIPEEYRHLLEFNPMYAFTNAYHQILVYQTTPDLLHLVPIIGVSLLLLLLGLFLFRRSSAEMVDVL